MMLAVTCLPDLYPILVIQNGTPLRMYGLFIPDEPRMARGSSRGDCSFLEGYVRDRTLSRSEDFVCRASFAAGIQADQIDGTAPRKPENR